MRTSGSPLYSRSLTYGCKDEKVKKCARMLDVLKMMKQQVKRSRAPLPSLQNGKETCMI